MPAANHDDNEATRPAETAEQKAERDMQREGRWLIIGGAAFAGIALLTAATFRELADQPFPNEWLGAAFLAAAVAILAGLWERATRPTRQALGQALRNHATILEHLGRIDTAFAGLAESLPADVDRRWWQGYATAASDGLVGEVLTPPKNAS